MTNILGISAYYHDSAAALVVDGRIVAAAQEERFTRKKHDAGFPVRAIQYCLEEGGLGPETLDYVGFYEKPYLKFERLLETYLAHAPAGLASFLKGMPVWFRQKLFLSREIRAGLKGGFQKKIVFTEHHESHAASAFFPSPFQEAAFLTMDGVGEWATASWGQGKDNRLRIRGELHFPHSLGLLYSAFTYYCGFRVNSGEYKLMGLAPYGRPVYAETIREKLLDLKEDGSFRLDLSYFEYWHGLRMTSKKFEKLFGGPARPPDSPVTQKDMDLAASIQVVTEEIMLRMARFVHRQTGLENLCLAGGVALNCVGNGRLLREGPFRRLWIQPAAGDAGGALGIALFIWHQLLDKARQANPEDSMQGALLGPAFTDEAIQAFLESKGARYHPIPDEAQLCAQVSNSLVEGKIVGWVQGRMEFGPRALGCRSILGDARSPEMQSVMNLKTKFRESFRPFAPVVLQEHAHEWFDLPPGVESPYMLLVAPVAEAHRRPMDESERALSGMAALKVVRSSIPAVTHLDYSARVQTVDEHRHGRFHRLMKRFQEATGCPVLVNTSFNVRGEPIVCSPEDAWRCFLGTNIDVLVLEKVVLFKDEQPTAALEEAAIHLSQFKPD